MNIEIQKLTPALAEDYANFFDTTPHNNTNDNDKCYCLSFCHDKVYQNGGNYWYNTSEERRSHAIQRVRDGNIQGYLAYVDGEIVGWCNANTKADCEECMNAVRTHNGMPVDPSRVGEKVKYIACFAIAPHMQGKGVATALLEYACQDAAECGFDFAEAATHMDLTQDGFRGPVALYEKCGFVRHAENDGKVVMRKALSC